MYDVNGCPSVAIHGPKNTGHSKEHWYLFFFFFNTGTYEATLPYPTLKTFWSSIMFRILVHTTITQGGLGNVLQSLASGTQLYALGWGLLSKGHYMQAPSDTQLYPIT